MNNIADLLQDIMIKVKSDNAACKKCYFGDINDRCGLSIAISTKIGMSVSPFDSHNSIPTGCTEGRDKHYILKTVDDKIDYDTVIEKAVMAAKIVASHR